MSEVDQAAGQVAGTRRAPEPLQAGAAPEREDLRRASVPIDQFPSWRGTALSFVLCVLAPVLVAALYYGLFAADQYVAELRFSVRSAGALPATDSDFLSALASRGAGGDDVKPPYMAANYLRSRNALRDVDAEIGLRALYARPQADFWARFDPAGDDDRLWSRWRAMTAASVDRVSGLVLFRAQAFTPQDAKTIAEAAERAASRMIDDVSARARKDALDLAEAQIDAAGARYAEALAGLRQVREEEGEVDPKTTIGLRAETLLGVMRRKLALERQFEANRRIGAEKAPQQKVLADQIAGLEAQIREGGEAIAGESARARTAASTMANFERRELERRFAERLLEVAQAAGERARLEYERRQLYLAVFSPPRLPERAELPRRLREIAFVGLAALGLWTTATVARAGLRDRKNID
ncbi:hypothetical protein [Methylocella sp.]|uniref:hypothetical protein n=1 Tax=Methylocella sp. TaxID=1978226 RepID=UPI0037847E09